jgi:hypothetical protein
MADEGEKASVHKCACGFCFSVRPEPNQSVLCSRCGRIVVLRTRGAENQKDFQDLIEAAAEVLAEGDPPISGAR